MPFKSKKQMRYLFWRHPDIARRWVRRYGIPRNLPEKVKRKLKALKRYKKEKRR